GQCLYCGRRRATEHGTEPGGGPDQRAGLVGDDAQVVLDRVRLARADGLGDLSVYQSRERPGLNPYRLGAQLGGEVRGPGEKIVAGEYRDGVPPTGVRRRGTTSHRRLVHDVVVVERGEMSELDDHRRRHNLRPARVAELRGERDEQWPETLTTRVHEVPGDLGQHGI